MTIVLINDFGYANGGASQVAIENALSVKKAGCSVLFFTAVGPIDERLKQAGIEIISTEQEECLNYKSKISGALTGLWNMKAYHVLSQLLQRLDVDSTIIHIHVWVKALSPSIFAAIAKYHFKIVITVHDYFLACPNGGFYDYRKQKICPYRALSWQCICTNCDKRNYAQKLYRVIRQNIQNTLIAKNQINLIFVSGFSERILHPQLPYSYQGQIISNPVRPIPKMDEDRHYLKDSYIYLGRLSPEKGADLFCEAIYQLGLKGILIGDGESRRELESKYQKYAGLQFVGWRKHDEIGQYLQKGKALIVPSRGYETAVLTIPEVQANYDLPIIVGDQCAGKEFMQHGRVFQSGNLSDLISCIQKFEKNGYDKKLDQNRNLMTTEKSVCFLVQKYKEILELGE